jgi:hypothetical protein
MSVGWTCVFACLAVTRTVGGQATFSSGANTVAIYVTVVGEGGALQSGLSAKDFDVRDDGQVRTITQFESGSLPITMAVLLDDSPSLRASQPVTQSAATATAASQAARTSCWSNCILHFR